MKFILDPTKGALVPELIKEGAEKAAEAAFDSFTAMAVAWIEEAGKWFLESGLPLIAEGLLIWGMVCFLVACTGSGKWIERGAKAVGMSLMVGLVQYAV